MEVLGINIPVWLLIVTLLLYLLYRQLTKNFGFFKELGINGPRPYPIVGTALRFFRKGLPAADMEVRQKYGKVVGTFLGSKPTLVIFDTDMLKQIMVKNFNSFQNRRPAEFKQYPFEKMLTILTDDHWKHVRNLVTPTFSGSRLRKMMPRINKCAVNLRENLGEKAKNDEMFNLKDLAGCYTMDVIASTAFGLEVDSQKDPNSQFVTMAKKSMIQSSRDPRLTLFVFFPFLIKYLTRIGVTIMPKDCTAFFTGITKKAMERRDEQSAKEKHTDFLQLMVNARLDIPDSELAAAQGKGGDLIEDSSGIWSKSGLTEEEILAQSLIFFMAGFETVALTLSVLGYSLACNPEKQDTLIEEIDDVTTGHEEIDYDLVKKLPYLDMCLDEAMRLYPAALRVDRVAGEDVTISGLFIPKGTVVGIPVYALHHDPELWENPEQFIPERFSAEAKETMDPYSYMPFGLGPRNCVGMRLALIELKVAVAQVLKQYKFVTCEKTEIPYKMKTVSADAENGFMLKMKARN